MRPSRPPLPAPLAALLFALAFAGTAHSAPPWIKGARDHSLCCGLKVPLNVDGVALDLSDPAYEKIAARHAAIAAAAPSSSSAPSAPSPAAAPTPPTPSAPVAPPTLLRLPGPPLSALDQPLETQAGYAKIAFSQLAGFTFTAPVQPLPAGTTPPDVLAQVPASIKRLDGKKVVLTGFMLPTKMEGGFATEFFFLSSSQLCCFGVTPTANEWMLVKMKKEGIPAAQDVPVSLAGRLRVRAQWTDGFLTSIYELEGDGLLKTKS